MTKDVFDLQAPYKTSPDQEKAIEELIEFIDE